MCTFHHRLVHAGGWHVGGHADAPLTFHARTGRIVTEPPDSQPDSMVAAGDLPGAPVDAGTIATAGGGRLDLDWTVTALVSLLAPHDN